MTAPALTGPQQAFVSAILQGKSQGQAYKEARFPGAAEASKALAEKRGSKVAKGASVGDALARARANIQAQVELTTADLVAQLLEARTIALSVEPVQVNAAVAATMGIGKLLGLAVDRSEVNIIHHKPSLLPTTQLELSVDEWRKQFGAN